MRTSISISRIVAFCLASGLVLPSPVFSLRNSQPEYQTQLTGMEQALTGLEKAGMEEIPGVHSSLPDRWIWLERVLRIIEVLDDPDSFRGVVSDHLAAYGPTVQTVQATWNTMEAFQTILLDPQTTRAKKTLSTKDRILNSILLLRKASPEEELFLRITLLSESPAYRERLKDLRSFHARFLGAVAWVTANDRSLGMVKLHQEVKRAYWSLLRESWMSEAGQGGRPESFLWNAIVHFPDRPEDRQKRMLASNRYFLGSATLTAAELVRELETVEETEETTVDLGFGPVTTTLQGLRNRLQNDVSIWGRMFALRYETAAPPSRRLIVRVSVAPKVRVEVLGDLREMIGLREEESLFLRAGTLGDLRRQIATRLWDSSLRQHFLSVPADEVVDIERDGKDVASIRDEMPLQPEDVLFVVLPPKLDPNETWAGLANAFYRVPELYVRHFGDISRQGPFEPDEWKEFLAAVEKKDPEAYESLKKLPVPERYVVHADLLRYKPSGLGFLVTGSPGSGKSFLSDLLIAGSEGPSNLPNRPGSKWEYLVNDRLFVLRVGDQLIGGMFPGYPPEKLTSRYPIPGANVIHTDTSRGSKRLVYETSIPEKQQFVPLRGIAWLNRQPSLKGRRDLKIILGDTDRWGQIGWTWPADFSARIQKLPVHEEFLGTTAGLPKFQQVASEITSWAGRFLRQTHRAGMEETWLIVQPGEGVSGALYEKTLPAGLSPLENVAEGPLADLLKGHEIEGVPVGARMALRIVPGRWLEAQEWVDLGLEPLLDPIQAIANFVQYAEGPPVVATEADGREYLEFQLPSGHFYQVDDLPALKNLKVFSAQDYGFETKQHSEKFQEQVKILKQITDLRQNPAQKEQLRLGLKRVSKELLLSQLESAQANGKLVLVGVPLGIPDKEVKKRFAAEADLPTDRLISESELKEKLKPPAGPAGPDQKKEPGEPALPPEAGQFNALIESFQQTMRGTLQQVQAEHEGYLSPERVNEIARRIDQLDSFRVRSAADATALGSAKGQNRLKASIMEHVEKTRNMVNQLPAQSPAGGVLRATVQKLAQEFPEILPVMASEPPATLLQRMFENSTVRENGWNPARLAQFLRLYRQTQQDLQKRLPGSPWFEGLVLEVKPDRWGHSHFLCSGSSQTMVLVLNLGKPAKKILSFKDYAILQSWADGLLLMDPAIEQVSPDYWKVFRKEPSLEVQIQHLYGRQPQEPVSKSKEAEYIGEQMNRVRTERLRQGLSGHAWFTGVPVALTALPQESHFRKMNYVEGSAPWLAGERIAFLLARDLSAIIDAYLSVSEHAILDIEKERAKLSTLKDFKSQWTQMGRKGRGTHIAKGISKIRNEFVIRVSTAFNTIVFLTRERVRLEYFARDPAYRDRAEKALARVERLSSKIMEENQEFFRWLLQGPLESAPSAETAVLRFNWDSYFNQMHQDLRTMFNGLELAIPAAPKTGEAQTAIQAGMEEVIARMRPVGEPASEQAVPLRFLVDTYRGDARVLRLLQLAVLLNIRQGLPIQAAGVATEEQAARALAQLPPDAGDLFRQLVVTYRAGDEADYQFARAVAEGTIQDFHPELEITTVEDPTVIEWFFEALQRLGIEGFSIELQRGVMELIESV